MERQKKIMNNLWLIARFFLFLSVISPFFLYAQSFNSNLIQGEWQVDRVLINMNTERTTNYQYDDARLVGRSVIIDEKRIASNITGFSVCEIPSFSVKDKTLLSYFSNIMKDTDGSQFGDYSFKQDKLQQVKEINVSCGKGNVVNSDTGDNVEFALLSNGMYMNWVDGTFLHLTLIDTDKKISPSFSCSGSLNKTEEAICRDDELSSYDRSVNSAFVNARSEAKKLNDKSVLDKIIKDQKEWIEKRNTCSDNASCIKDRMIERLNEIH